ncbi:Protein CBG10697 [Caenorhabditis briggsae]|uniref:Protein CBG10697 n=1 Tax=Caenorhabditis briggsae TaxID=6238 RepID=A8XBL0_CAEBR|nr:Protein CBG10697 [Caenorhabditis briggsae]CAP30026.2 Protein CBG10697 [Caenorhabditis briggsae]
MREGHHPRHREVLEGFLNGELRDYGEAVEHRLRQLMKSNRPATMMEIEELKNMSYNMELRTTKGSFEGYIFAVKEGLQDVEAELRRMENVRNEPIYLHVKNTYNFRERMNGRGNMQEIQKQQLPTTMACNRGIYDTIKFRREVMREMFQIEQKKRIRGKGPDRGIIPAIHFPLNGGDVLEREPEEEMNKKPHFAVILEDERNVNPNMVREWRSSRYHPYVKRTVDKKIEWLTEDSAQVIYHHDKYLLYCEGVRLKNRVEKLGLSNVFVLREDSVEQIHKRSYHLALRALENYGAPQAWCEMRPFVLSATLPTELRHYSHKHFIYTPPTERLRISTDISWSRCENYTDFKIPMYSDRPYELWHNLILPRNICFDYIDNNIVDKVTEPELAKIVELASQEGNHIKCPCKPITPGGFANCFENSNCPCYKTNIMLRKLNSAENNKTVFNSFDPLEYNGDTPAYHNHGGFACSEICGCGGRCNNNALIIAQAKIFPTEIYRKSDLIGFRVRATSYIPAGTPVMEFIGELVRDRYVEGDALDYSMQLSDKMEDIKYLLALLAKEKVFPATFLKQLRQSYKEDVFLDCLHQGNKGRFLMHSCVANLEPVRIYQKSFSPAHAKMVMYSTKAIMPGEQLTLNYGSGYVGLDKVGCQCGAFSCKNGRHAGVFSKLSVHGVCFLADCFTAHQIESIREYEADREENNRKYGRFDVDLHRKDNIPNIESKPLVDRRRNNL